MKAYLDRVVRTSVVLLCSCRLYNFTINIHVLFLQMPVQLALSHRAFLYPAANILLPWLHIVGKSKLLKNSEFLLFAPAYKK